MLKLSPDRLIKLLNQAEKELKKNHFTYKLSFKDSIQIYFKGNKFEYVTNGVIYDSRIIAILTNKMSKLEKNLLDVSF
jgi:hypothetical protein